MRNALEVYRSYRNGTAVDLHRCPLCWATMANEKTLDNGFVAIDMPIVHDPRCPNIILVVQQPSADPNDPRREPQDGRFHATANHVVGLLVAAACLVWTIWGRGCSRDVPPPPLAQVAPVAPSQKGVTQKVSPSAVAEADDAPRPHVELVRLQTAGGRIREGLDAEEGQGSRTVKPHHRYRKRDEGGDGGLFNVAPAPAAPMPQMPPQQLWRPQFVQPHGWATTAPIQPAPQWGVPVGDAGLSQSRRQAELDFLRHRMAESRHGRGW